MVLTVEAIGAEDPAAVILSADAAGETLPASPDLAELAALASARTFVATDLITGRVNDTHPLYNWLLRNGMSEQDIAWHAERFVQIDIVGVNYYPESSVTSLRQVDGEVTLHGGSRMWGGPEGLARSVGTFARRYGRPVMITETSTNGSLELRGQWLAESLATIRALRRQGVPLVGYTWWPLFDLIDWSYRHGARPIEEFITRLGPPRLDVEQISATIELMGWSTLQQLPLEAYLAHMGLYELQMQFDGTFARTPSPLVALYKEAIAEGVSEMGEDELRIADCGLRIADC
jgi:hypothetical protein